MFENFLDNYAHSNAIRNVNTYFKVLFGIITLIVSLISTSPIVPLIIFICVSLIIVYKAEIPVNFYLKFLIVPLTFASITFIYMAIFFGTGQHIFNYGFLNLSYLQMDLIEDFSIFKDNGWFCMYGIFRPDNSYDRTVQGYGKYEISQDTARNLHVDVSLYIRVHGRSRYNVPFTRNQAGIFKY